ncbi:MAG: thiamine-phosphate pyrophosphorylase [Candidatus Omnitrophica bacterium]|nr:thiamine-phosphate pyrophosphorylase [Candidatus Omnitrophota bacterium]
MRKIDEKKVYRLVDANFNRAKEALRVCEDVCRFFFDLPTLTRSYKNVRHSLTKLIEPLNISHIILSRDIENDKGRGTTKSELTRSKVEDIFYANSQRIKESIRVLEECTKLLDQDCSMKLKQLRYKVYELEKKVIGRF